MYTSPWFDDLPVIGKMPPEQAAAKLSEMGETEAAEMLAASQSEPSPVFRGGTRKGWWPF